MSIDRQKVIRRRRVMARNAWRLLVSAAAMIASVPQASADTPAPKAILAHGEDPAIKAFEAGFRPSVHVVGTPPTHWPLLDRMAFWHVPGLSVAVIRNGHIAWTKGYGVRRVGRPEPVDSQTLFSVGSLSKVGTAAITLHLVSQGRLDLDRNVNAYLKRWQVPDDARTALRPVTLRGILSHSGGLSIDGFADFQPGEPLPTLVETLDGKGPAKEDPVRVIYTPGTMSAYSGGGVEVERLAIEDVTGLPFAEVADRMLLGPLRMGRSTYAEPLPANTPDVAMAHDEKGTPRALPTGWETMPQNAASGLWTTPGDYARLMIALRDAYLGQPGAMFGPDIAHAMMTEVGGSHAGLGPFLAGIGSTRRFYHSGANDSYRAWMEMNLATGNGVVIFTNSPNGTKLRPEVTRAIASAEGWATSDSVEVPAIQITASQRAGMAGRYVVQDRDDTIGQRLQTEGQPVFFTIAQDGDALTASNGADATPMPLIPADQSHFYFYRTADKSIEFVPGYDGHIDRLIYRDRDYAIEARKLPSAS